MITIKDVREYLKTKIDCPYWYGGKIDASKEKCIGIYNIEGEKPYIALGGLECTSFTSKAISILVHWTNNSNEAELKAQEIYKKLLESGGTIGGHKIIMINLKSEGPVSIGTDENGIFEYVINLSIKYER